MFTHLTMGAGTYRSVAQKLRTEALFLYCPLPKRYSPLSTMDERRVCSFVSSPTNSHFNRKIRDIIIKAGLPSHTEATSHTARHTFATTICLENGLPIETVSKMLGHRFISTTELYAKVSKSKIAREMQPLIGSNTTRELRKALRVCPPRKPSIG